MQKAGIKPAFSFALNIWRDAHDKCTETNCLVAMLVARVVYIRR